MMIRVSAFLITLLCSFSINAATLFTYEWRGTIEQILYSPTPATFNGYVGQSASVSFSVRSDASDMQPTVSHVSQYALEDGSFTFGPASGSYTGAVLLVNDRFDIFRIASAAGGQPDLTSTSGAPADHQITQVRSAINDSTGMIFPDISLPTSFAASDFNFLEMYVDFMNINTNEMSGLKAVFDTLTVTESQISTVPLPASFPLYASAIAVLGLLGWRRKSKQNKIDSVIKV